MPTLIALTFIIACGVLSISLYNAFLNRRRLEFYVSDTLLTVDEINLFFSDKDPLSIDAEGKYILHMTVVNPTTHTITFWPPEVINAQTRDSVTYYTLRNIINLDSFCKAVSRKGETNILTILPTGTPCVCPGNGIVEMDLIVDDIPGDYLVCVTYAVRTLFKQYHPINPQRYRVFREIVSNRKDGDN